MHRVAGSHKHSVNASHNWGCTNVRSILCVRTQLELTPQSARTEAKLKPQRARLLCRRACPSPREPPTSRPLKHARGVRELCVLLLASPPRALLHESRQVCARHAACALPAVGGLNGRGATLARYFAAHRAAGNLSADNGLDRGCAPPFDGGAALGSPSRLLALNLRAKALRLALSGQQGEPLPARGGRPFLRPGFAHDFRWHPCGLLWLWQRRQCRQTRRVAL